VLPETPPNTIALNGIYKERIRSFGNADDIRSFVSVDIAQSRFPNGPTRKPYWKIFSDFSLMIEDKNFILTITDIGAYIEDRGLKSHS